MGFKVLIAEDEEITLKHLTNALREEGCLVSGVRNGLDALARLETEHYELLIADIKMPGMTGMQLLERIAEKQLDTETIIITGFGSIGSVVEAMKRGAYDYVTKPFDMDELLMKVGKIRGQRSLKKENAALKAYAGMDRKVSIIAGSASMNKILGVIEEMKDSDCNVLLTGETGVGKSLLAKIIHYTCRRQAMPFLSINCATLTEELLASELFGHEKGAFTGALKMKPGLVEIADSGTLFLDEIAEMAPKLQAKLLKVMEEGEFYRVGGTRTVRVDVRFIAATNRNVRSTIAEGRFREDLYYRLNIMEIHIPPLRERREDIPPLCAYFLDKHVPSSHKAIEDFTPEAMNVLKQYGYPGNVRELENLVERAIILEKGRLITPESLPQTIKLYQVETLEPDRIKTLEELNREYAERVTDLLGGNRSKAADALGISRTSLWRILKEEAE
jgi:DNA-binding NtrC family response regulator